MYFIAKFSKTTTTDTNVNNSVGSASDYLGPATPNAYRQAVRITNCAALGSSTYVYIGHSDDSTAPTLTTTAYDDVLAPGAAITYQANANIRFYAINNTSPESNTNVRLVEYI